MFHELSVLREGTETSINELAGWEREEKDQRTSYAVRRDRCHQPGWKPLFEPQPLSGAQLLSLLMLPGQACAHTSPSA